MQLIWPAYNTNYFDIPQVCISPAHKNSLYQNARLLYSHRGPTLLKHLAPIWWRASFDSSQVSQSLGDSPQAHQLLKLYIFKILPCLNPDGVIAGNFRYSMNGCDLNRKWNNPKKTLHSSIYYLKNYIKKLITHDKKEVAVFCDLHGHGKKCNSFIYGCDKAANGGFCSWTKVRLLPRILAKNTLLFNYQDCTFRVEPDKQHTARVVLWKEFSVTNSFTLEASFFGYMKGDTVFKYTKEDFFEIGESLMKSLLEYSNLLKQLEHDLIITKGWLKPSKLIQITGTPAADVFKRSLSLQKEEAKKKQRQDKVNQYLIKIKEKSLKTYLI